MMNKLIIALFCVLLSSCYTNSEEDLYPKENCDTNNVSYNKDIMPIINNACFSCHSGTGASGGVSLENYGDIKNATLTGNLLNSLKGENGVSQMPQGGKLADCEIKKINAWAKAGAPKN